MDFIKSYFFNRMNGNKDWVNLLKRIDELKQNSKSNVQVIDIDKLLDIALENYRMLYVINMPHIRNIFNASDVLH